MSGRELGRADGVAAFSRSGRDEILGGRTYLEVVVRDRIGGIWHAVGDLAAVREALGFEPKAELCQRSRSFVNCLRAEPATELPSAESVAELARVGFSANVEAER
jgi:hypothetical protein